MQTGSNTATTEAHKSSQDKRRARPMPDKLPVATGCTRASQSQPGLGRTVNRHRRPQRPSAAHHHGRIAKAQKGRPQGPLPHAARWLRGTVTRAI